MIAYTHPFPWIDTPHAAIRAEISRRERCGCSGTTLAQYPDGDEACLFHLAANAQFIMLASSGQGRSSTNCGKMLQQKITMTATSEFYVLFSFKFSKQF